MSILIEVRRNIKGYEWLYMASDWGRIKSLLFWKEKIMKQSRLPKGYMFVILWKNNKCTHKYVHRLKAIAFHPNPENKRTVNHLDGNPSNNWYNAYGKDNVAWATDSEQHQHAYKTLRRKNPSAGKFWKNNPTSKKVNQYTLTWEFIKRWDSMADIQRKLWYNYVAISMCCSWKYKTSRWYIWKIVQ